MPPPIHLNSPRVCHLFGLDQSRVDPSDPEMDTILHRRVGTEAFMERHLGLVVKELTLLLSQGVTLGITIHWLGPERWLCSLTNRPSLTTSARTSRTQLRIYGGLTCRAMLLHYDR